MKSIFISLIGLFCIQGAAFSQIRDVDLGVRISDGRLRDFYLAIGDHYHVAPRQVVEVREHYRLPEEELPVVYFLAARAHVGPEAIVRLRLGRMSWLDIAFHYHLTPDIFFVPVVVERMGPPYGHAYGLYRKHRRKGDWRRMRLADREVVDLVNLRFMSEHYRMAPEEVIRMRGHEKRFVYINDEIRRGKEKGRQEKQRKKKGGKRKN